MQEDFHYYATYCAAFLAGYTPAESSEIAYSAQFVDLGAAGYNEDLVILSFSAGRPLRQKEMERQALHAEVQADL